VALFQGFSTKIFAELRSERLPNFAHGPLDKSIDEKMACNRFASAFLLPDIGVYQHLGNRRSNIGPKELYFFYH
jgi:hypothetical protein